MRPIGDKLLIATHNSGKLREIAALMEPLGIACVGAEELGLPEPDEIGNTFADNADLKAREAADLSGLPALADDSEALDAYSNAVVTARARGPLATSASKAAFARAGACLRFIPKIKSTSSF